MENKSANRVTLLNVTIFVEAILLLVATAWAKLAEIPVLGGFHGNFKVILYGLGAGTLMATAGFGLFALSKSLNAFTQLRDIVEKLLAPLVADLNLFDLLLLSCVTGFCEEVFFRGIIQAQFNIFVASLTFGFFHDPSFKHVSYCILAFLYGLALGGLLIYTGSLWAPICAHTMHNLISLCILRYRMKPPAAATGTD
jgi:membrane protease YdiL (CAAX protease family)